METPQQAQCPASLRLLHSHGIPPNVDQLVIHGWSADAATKIHQRLVGSIVLQDNKLVGVVAKVAAFARGVSKLESQKLVDGGQKA
jgi:hypothetical protein